MRHLVRGAKRTCVARRGRTLEGTRDDLEARKCSLDDAFTATRVNLPREQDGAGFRETPYSTDCASLSQPSLRVCLVSCCPLLLAAERCVADCQGVERIPVFFLRWLGVNVRL